MSRQNLEKGISLGKEFVAFCFEYSVFTAVPTDATAKTLQEATVKSSQIPDKSA